MRKVLKCNNGAAMPFAIFLVLILTFMTGVMFTSLQNEIKARTATENRIKAKYVAEAGIEHGIFSIYSTINQIFDPSHLPNKDEERLFEAHIGLEQLSEDGLIPYTVSFLNLNNLPLSQITYEYMVINMGNEENPAYNVVWIGNLQPLEFYIVSSAATEPSYTIKARVAFTADYLNLYCDHQVVEWSEVKNGN